MSNFWITVTHTAEKRIKSKAFIWSTIIISLIMIALMNFGTIANFFSDEDENEHEKANVLVVLETADEILEKLLLTFTEGEFTYVLHKEGIDSAQKTAQENDDLNFVLILSGEPSQLQAQLYASSTDFRLAQQIRMEIQRIKETVVTNELGLNESELAMIYSPVEFLELPLSETTELKTEESHMQSYWMVYALVFTIYMIIILFGSIIATEVATEKSSRVMELIVSSVNPVTQMFGKIIGIGLSGIVNILTIIVAALIGYKISGEQFLDRILDVVDVSLLGYAIVLIILGYLLYGGVAAMLGALVSRAEEVNQAIQPVVFLSMISFFVSIFGLNVPDATFIQVLSYIPFFTPQLLFLRIGMTTVPTWEIVLILVILVISVILINLLAAKVYKGGVLMYGKFTFKNGIKQALQLGKKEK